MDFRKLVAREELHPGLIVLPSVSRARSLHLLEAAIAHLSALSDAPSVMVNHVLEVDDTGQFKLSPLPG